MRALLVEDNAAQRKQLEPLLAAMGLEVTAFGNGQEAFFAHLRHPFDIMVIDWVVPGLDGLQLCHRVRALPNGEHPYILMVTSRDRSSDLTDALNAGADDYIAKPVDPGLLETRIHIAKRRVRSNERHRAAREALAQSEVDFRRVIERCPFGVFAQRNAEIVYINQAALSMLSANKEQVLGASILEFVQPRWRESVRDNTLHFERTDMPTAAMEVELLRFDGQSVIVRMIPASRAIYKGERAAFVLVEDISERRRAEQELRLMQFGIDHAGDAALWIDEAGRITYANHAACSLMGYERPHLVGSHIGTLDDTLSGPGWEEAWKQAFSRKREPKERVFRRDDGETVPVEVSATGVEFNERRLVITFFRDLTDRQRLAASLQKADRLASVGSLAAGVAHEINNPLAYVIANLELIREDVERWKHEGELPSVGELHHSIQEVVEGVHRVRRIVGDLKSFARSNDEDAHAVDIHDVLDAAIDIVANEIRHRAVLVRDYGDVSHVVGNEGRLIQVALNLLVNAAHAIPEDKQNAHRITVRTAPADEDGWIHVDIADTGAGISPDIIDHIFDPFFTTKPQGVGTGLGLSICHGIVTGLGGKIEVDSQPGQGSTFRLRLPRATPAETSTCPASATAFGRSSISGPSISILVVDDERMICEGIRRALATHEVCITSSPRDALDLCRERSFDLILCDVMMPDVSGIELYRRVVEEWPGWSDRFVFMTGGAFTPKTREFLSTIENEQIGKPFTLRELREMVARRAGMVLARRVVSPRSVGT